MYFWIKPITTKKYKTLSMTKLKRNPTETLKRSANKQITAHNAEVSSLKIQKIVGDYQPGYLYGNIKTHKPQYLL